MPPNEHSIQTKKLHSLQITKICDANLWTLNLTLCLASEQTAIQTATKKTFAAIVSAVQQLLPTARCNSITSRTAATNTPKNHVTIKRNQKKKDNLWHNCSSAPTGPWRMTELFRENVQAAVKTGRRNGPTQSEQDRTDNQRRSGWEDSWHEGVLNVDLRVYYCGGRAMTCFLKVPYYGKTIGIPIRDRKIISSMLLVRADIDITLNYWILFKHQYQQI